MSALEVCAERALSSTWRVTVVKLSFPREQVVVQGWTVKERSRRKSWSAASVKLPVVYDRWASCKGRLDSSGPQLWCNRKQNPLYIVNINKSQVGQSLNARIGSCQR